MRRHPASVSRETAGRPGPAALPGALLPAVLLASTLLLTACAGIAGPEGWAAPVATDDSLLVSLDRGKLTSIDPSLGPASKEVRWTFPGDSEQEKDLKLEAIYGTPVVAGDRVYLGGYDGAVYAIESATGAPIWRYETGGAVIGGVALASDVLYVGSLDKKVYALDAASGRPRWPQPLRAGAEIYAQPIVEGDLVYVATMGGKLLALEAASGQPRWTFEAEAALPAAPALAGGTLYVGSLDDHLYALDAGSGEVLWSVAADNWFWTTPLVAEGAVYAPALDKKVYALDAASGEPRWPQPFETLAPARLTPALVGGVLLVADRDGNVYGLNPDDGREAWAPLKLDAGILANPLVLDEAVYLIARNGDLVRIDPSVGECSDIRGTACPGAPPTPVATGTSETAQ